MTQAKIHPPSTPPPMYSAILTLSSPPLLEALSELLPSSRDKIENNGEFVVQITG
eukprot:CAMPEP_0168576214 /NCGR_PEP_ID=MMETSP0413-20121227/20116_1 /TAXON_ID=136452 /ORGANISM="Filamoeba nolandi, Strain NC-AS-23-1" /LENGTH=54 /DNA_ID=CAMNT_0008609851 /DNA_START=7 /DNA_END=167 /DNA_ORIENTATION=-